MDDRDLRALDREPLGAGGRPRPVGDVLRRGRQLRRRSAAVRTVPVVAVLVAAATAGVAALRGDDPAPDMAVGPAGVAELPTKVGCEPPDPEHVPADQLDGLLLVPTWLPDGIEVSSAGAVRQSAGTCSEVDPALVLRAVADDGTVTAELVLEGPFGAPYQGADDVMLEPTQLRDRAASRTFDPTARDSYVGFTWTEPDGASWLLTGTGSDEDTVRSVAEALDLAGPPPEGEPAAALPDDAVPAGFTQTWQAPGLPAEEAPTHLEFQVTTTETGFPTCEVTLGTTILQAPPGRLHRAEPDVTAAEVELRNGRPGFAIEENGATFLDWQEAPGVAGRVICPGTVDDALQIAESLEEVAPDDPRIAAP